VLYFIRNRSFFLSFFCGGKAQILLNFEKASSYYLTSPLIAEYD